MDPLSNRSIRQASSSDSLNSARTFRYLGGRRSSFNDVHSVETPQQADDAIRRLGAETRERERAISNPESERLSSLVAKLEALQTEYTELQSSYPSYVDDYENMVKVCDDVEKLVQVKQENVKLKQQLKQRQLEQNDEARKQLKAENEELRRQLQSGEAPAEEFESLRAELANFKDGKFRSAEKEATLQRWIKDTKLRVKDLDQECNSYSTVVANLAGQLRALGAEPNFGEFQENWRRPLDPKEISRAKAER